MKGNCMIKNVCAGIALFVASSLPTHAAESDWVEVSATDVNAFSIQVGSVEVGKNKGGAKIFSVTGRVLNKQTKSITVETWYVTASDCELERGSLVTLTIAGEYKFENDFVSGDGSVGGSIADIICGAGLALAKKQDAKGI